MSHIESPDSKRRDPRRIESPETERRPPIQAFGWQDHTGTGTTPEAHPHEFTRIDESDNSRVKRDERGHMLPKEEGGGSKQPVRVIPSNPSRRPSGTGSSSGGSRFHCEGKFGTLGNCIVCSLGVIFILTILVLGFIFSDGSSSEDDNNSGTKKAAYVSSTSSGPPGKWDGVYNGTYEAMAGSERFSESSASRSKNSVVYRFAASEHVIRIDKGREQDGGDAYFEFRSRNSAQRDFSKGRKMVFFSGQPFTTAVNHGDWFLSSTATVTVRGDTWREKYPGNPDLEVTRKFEPDGKMLVTYTAEDVKYYKRFIKTHYKK